MMDIGTFEHIKKLIWHKVPFKVPSHNSNLSYWYDKLILIWQISINKVFFQNQATVIQQALWAKRLIHHISKS
jgi:hypothetical protein